MVIGQGGCNVKNILILISFVLFVVSVKSSAEEDTYQANKSLQRLIEHQWKHGARDCSKNTDPAIEVFRYDQDTYILRQNKCVHYEAPFIYLLFGEDTLLIQDTGATADPLTFPLYETVQDIITQRNKALNLSKPLNILVTHSHSHGDHTAADTQFKGKPRVTVVEPSLASIKEVFGLTYWPAESVDYDLGKRNVIIIPIPGHQAESIALYDKNNQWLLTGDTFYPGRLYVRDWSAFEKSIERLVSFTQSYPVKAILGTHIEMSKEAGVDYPISTIYQPNEASLPLTVHALKSLKSELDALNGRRKKVTKAKFIIYPV
jgi:glyoxylase-like metal-dependent hydrolase (beta-lactamase superfamily II)